MLDKGLALKYLQSAMNALRDGEAGQITRAVQVCIVAMDHEVADIKHVLSGAEER